MNDITSGLNPFSSENLPTLLISLLILGAILALSILIESYIIPHLSPENKFKIWWKNNVIDEDPHHL